MTASEATSRPLPALKRARSTWRARRRWVAAPIAALTLVSITPAHAEPPREPSAGGTPAEGDRAQIRERFRLGMEKYTQGQFKEAIGYWDAIYRELGPREGYRVSFNLARAYEKFSDYTLAAERYEAFLTELELRRQEGKPIEAILEREEKDARERLDELRASKGRIRVLPGKRAAEAKIDETDRRTAGFVAYVAPGPHTVVLLRGSQTLEKRSVNVKAGEMADVEPPEPPEPPAPPPLETVRETSHPFTPLLLVGGAGLTLMSAIIPAVVYANALSLKRQHDALLAPDGTTTAANLADAISLETRYASSRDAAYGALAVPISLAALTGALTAWYFLGTKEREVVLRPPAAGLGLGAEGRF